ncbi:MAG: sugar transferase, partial [Muribaculaceae bacterium]|nr:sugar transferase [Muribaculaceae bacterium]
MKYVVCDFLTANVAMLVFDIARYFILQQWNQGYPNLENFLLSTNLLWEQAIIPPILLVIYYFSGYYNLPFQKSRLQELFTTIISCILYTLLIYFALLTNDQVQLRSTNYELLMSLFSIFFVFTYIGRISITSHCIRQMKKKHWSINTLIIG